MKKLTKLSLLAAVAAAQSVNHFTYLNNMKLERKRKMETLIKIKTFKPFKSKNIKK